MKKIFFVLLLFQAAYLAKAQKSQDLFRPDADITWLGIDFSHVKLVGNFAEFFNAGERSTWQIRDVYFPRWNAIILDEPDKYDIRGMWRKGDMGFDIRMITDINAQTPLEEMEAYNTTRFSEEDIHSFVQKYDFKGREGIGIVFIAECLDKNFLVAWYHVVAIDMHTREILLHERLSGEPRGFGIRNYWANSLYHVIRNIRDYYYWEWKNRAKNNSAHDASTSIEMLSASQIFNLM
jgi:hypothetical protein